MNRIPHAILLATILLTAQTHAALTILRQFAPTMIGDLTPSPIPITQITSNGITATATTTPAHGYQIGDTITLANSPHFNGPVTIASIPNPTTFTFATSTNQTDTGTFTATLSKSASLGTLYQGTFHIRGGGQKNIGDTTAGGFGHSVDPQIPPNGAGSIEHLLGPLASHTGGADQAFFVKSLTSIGGNKFTAIASVRDNAGNRLLVLGIDAITADFLAWTNYSNAGPGIDTQIPIPIRKWFRIRTCWNYLGQNRFQIICLLRIDGSSNWTTLYSNIIPSPGGGTSVDYFYGGIYSAPGGSPLATAFSGRYGMFTLFHLDNFTTDATAPIPNQIDAQNYNNTPQSTGYSWFVDLNNNTSKASDNNDGLTPQTPWLTVNKWNQEMQFAGLFSPPNNSAWQQTPSGIPLDITQPCCILNESKTLIAGLAYLYQHNQTILTGDTITLNNNANHEIRINSTINVRTDALTIKSSGGLSHPVLLTLFKIIPPNSWSHFTPAELGDQSKIYSSPDTAQQVVLYQNRTPLKHPTGPTIEAVAQNLNTTPGSFWTDGTTMYLHPRQDTNPSTDANIYERTQLTSSGPTGMAIASTHALIQAIQITGTTLTDPSAGSSVGGYAFGTVGSADSLVIYDHCTADFVDKHGFGNVGKNINDRFINLSCISQRGNPYTPGNQYWAWVDFADTGNGCQSAYINCNCGIGALQLIGSPSAQSNGYFWGSHANHGAPWSNHWFLNCDFTQANGLSGQTQALVNIIACQLRGTIGTGAGEIDQSKITDEYVVTGQYNNDTITFANNNNNRISLSNTTANFHQCTLDLTNTTAGAVYYAIGNKNWNHLNFQECIFINPRAQRLIDNFTNAPSADTLTTNHCKFQGVPTTVWINQAHGTGLTLPQAAAKTPHSGWTDTASQTATSPAGSDQQQ